MTGERRLFVSGAWAAPATDDVIDDVIDVVSPFTEQVIATVATPGPHDVNHAVAAAGTPFDDGPWPHLDRLDLNSISVARAS